MHIVREPSLLPVSLVFQYLARPHEPPLPQPVAPKLLRAADDLATITWGALQGMVQVHDLGFVYGCAPNGNGPAVGFRRQQHCVQGVLLDFSCSTCLAHAHWGQAFALQADRDVAAALLKRCRSHLALASCALALERVTAALVQLHRARDLRQAASVLQDVQASCVTAWPGSVRQTWSGGVPESELRRWKLSAGGRNSARQRNELGSECKRALI